MGEIRDFRDLVAWQKAFAVGVDVFQVTKRFPASERFGLTSQLRRAGVSVASNIAEGYGRQSRSDYLRFLRVARGSLYEIETQLEFAVQFDYLERTEFLRMRKQLGECGRVLAGLIRRLESLEG